MGAAVCIRRQPNGVYLKPVRGRPAAAIYAVHAVRRQLLLICGQCIDALDARLLTIPFKQQRQGRLALPEFAYAETSQYSPVGRGSGEP